MLSSHFCRRPIQRAVTIHVDSERNVLSRCHDDYRWIRRSRPTSTFGRLIAVVVTYTGILAIALPISVIGSNFTSHYEKARMERKQRDLHVLETRRKVANKFKSVISTRFKRVSSKYHLK